MYLFFLFTLNVFFIPWSSCDVPLKCQMLVLEVPEFMPIMYYLRLYGWSLTSLFHRILFEGIFDENETEICIEEWFSVWRDNFEMRVKLIIKFYHLKNCEINEILQYSSLSFLEILIKRWTSSSLISSFTTQVWQISI